MNSSFPCSSSASRQENGRGRIANSLAESSRARENGSHGSASAVRSSTRRPRLRRSIRRRFRAFRDRPLLDYHEPCTLPGDLHMAQGSVDNTSFPRVSETTVWGGSHTARRSAGRARTSRISLRAGCVDVEATLEFDDATARLDTKTSDVAIQTKASVPMRSPPSRRVAIVNPTVKLESLVGGVVFAERYSIQGEKPQGKPHCRYAADLVTSRRVVLKFYPEASHEWMNAIRVHQHMQRSKYIGGLLDVVEDENGFPPCLVFERGNYSLVDRLAARHPSSIEQRAILYSILEALEFLHGQNVIHGDLNPSNIMWFSSDFCWKLIDLDNASLPEEWAVVPPLVTHYSAPELARAFQFGRTHVQLGTAADMWSIGVIAFEMLTCSRVYDPARLEEHIQARMEELSHDRAEIPQWWLSADRRGRSVFGDEEQGLRFVQSLLCSCPSTRQTVNEALSDRLFRSATDIYQRVDTFEQSNADGGLRLVDIFHWPEWTWLQILSDHITLTLQVESFLKSSKPSDPFHLREAQETLRFYDDFLADYPVHILRLGQATRLRLRITPDEELAFPIEGVVSFCVEPPDEDFVALEMVQSRHGRTVDASALLQPSRFKSQKLHVISPYFGLVDRKYIKLTVRVRILLGAPFRREVDLYRLVYCKIVHPRNRLRFHRLVGMFDNQAEHDIRA